jgi:uncharacterized protein YcbX
MLLKRDPSAPNGLKNMHVPHFPEMTLFAPSITLPSESDPVGKITVLYRRLGTEGKGREDDKLEVPLVPSIEGLDDVDVDMHRSTTKAYNMGSEYNSWFSNRFGFEVVFAYLGGNKRKVLGSLNPNAAVHKQSHTNGTGSTNGWISSITKSIPFFNGPREEDEEDYNITFADCASYLIVTEESLISVSERLEGSEIDITKFRPNIVLSGSTSAWDEDFWGEIEICPSSSPESGARIVLTSNCARCKSINIDYGTGAPGTGPAGEVLKRLQSDRRVDKGSNYSPIFGRYGFLVKEGGKAVGEGVEIKIGDEVKVTRRNRERTTFGKWMTLEAIDVIPD